VIVRLKIQDTYQGLQATLRAQSEPGEAESNSTEVFLIKSKAEARKRASALARHYGLKTYRVLDRAVN